MVEETIRSIRETEEQADKLIRQAEEKKQEILEAKLHETGGATC